MTKDRVGLEKDAKWIVYVTDAGQASHFELVFAAARDAGWWEPATHRIDHVPFGLVCSADGKKYKTRSGEVVRLVDLLDEAVSRMYDVTVEHNNDRIERMKETGSAEDVSMSEASTTPPAYIEGDLVCTRACAYAASCIYRRMYIRRLLHR